MNPLMALFRTLVITGVTALPLSQPPSPPQPPPVTPPSGTIEMTPLSDLTARDDVKPSVIGARTVDPRLYPASFFSKDLQCTASLIGSRVILTAAHCAATGATLSLKVQAQKVSAVCTQAPDYHPANNPSPDYALCLAERDIAETPFFETINVDPSILVVKGVVRLTGFGCTKQGGGGDNTNTVFRVGEASITALPSDGNNFLVTKGKAALCFGDSGGASYITRGIDDDAPRIQVSVNAIGNMKDQSALASLSTPAAKQFINDWSTKHGVTICGVHSGATKCRPF
jgi:hypothetical protein